MVRLGIFRDHDARRRKLINGFLRHKKTQILFKCLHALDNGAISTQDLMNMARYNQKSGLLYIMRQIERQGFISIMKEGRRFVYNIRESGKEFLEIHEKLRNQYALAK